MFILTAHDRIVGINAASELIEIVPGRDLHPTVVEIPDDGEDKVFEVGPMSGFTMIRRGSGIHFVKDGYFLCAVPDGRPLVADRTKAAEWETFTLVTEEFAKRILRPDELAADEVARFGKKVSELIRDGKSIKLCFGCGFTPRIGFLNLDITIMAPSFALKHPEEYFIFPYADMSWGIPNDCVDYIFHEDFIEHISQLQQIQFLAESLRVLKPGCYHRVNTPNLIACMRRFSKFEEGYNGVYTGELRWGHISIFSPSSLKEIAELVGYREIIFTTKSHGVSPFAEADTRPAADRDEIVGNIYADLQK